jgi:hypothetical protein
MALCQQEPVIARVLHQAAARLDQPLLETGQGPIADPVRQHQPPPSEVIRDPWKSTLREALKEN